MQKITVLVRTSCIAGIFNLKGLTHTRPLIMETFVILHSQIPFFEAHCFRIYAGLKGSANVQIKSEINSGMN